MTCEPFQTTKMPLLCDHATVRMTTYLDAKSLKPMMTAWVMQSLAKKVLLWIELHLELMKRKLSESIVAPPC